MKPVGVSTIAFAAILVAGALLLFLAGTIVGQLTDESYRAAEFTMVTVIDAGESLPANWQIEVSPGVTMGLSDAQGRLALNFGSAECVDGHRRFTLAPIGPTYDLRDHLPAGWYEMKVVAREVDPAQWQATVDLRPVGESGSSLAQTFTTPRGCDWQG